ncbi:adaptor protein MecA [Bacillus carboniphilus]|uniref:Adapter protein MecA n=1 Tax=Bacillus carboniphilus TaxID=86663 RepID=A0ABY9JU56_9BACI|nr:adaptor protein MecA [Bacillus carboniphilus]WLR42951.1 adaptor protein MecA [Bacillus carboniphilus]
MDIERINENTVKFYVSYVDIEDRGFNREEIWYDRERSEELFWDMMDEISETEGFKIEGPLWIQVHAMDKGLEVVVTRAQVSKDGQKLELPIADDKLKSVPVDENIDSILNKYFNTSSDTEEDIEESDQEQLDIMLIFDDFEDLISLAKLSLEGFNNSLFSYNDKYYLYIEFNDEDDDDWIEDQLSRLLEFGSESRITVHRLLEYGKMIVEDGALSQIKQHFS